MKKLLLNAILFVALIISLLTFDFAFKLSINPVWQGVKDGIVAMVVLYIFKDEINSGLK